MALDDTDWDLLGAEEVSNMKAKDYHGYFKRLGRVGGPKALAILEKALSHPHDSVRYYNERDLAEIGGEKALALLEKSYKARPSYHLLPLMAQVGGTRFSPFWKSFSPEKNHIRAIGARKRAFLY